MPREAWVVKDQESPGPCCLSDPLLDAVVRHPCRLVSALYHMIVIKWCWTRKPVQWSWLACGRAFSPWLLADMNPPYPHPPSPKFMTPTLQWVTHTYFHGLVLSHCPHLLKLSKWPWKGSGWGSGQAPLTRAFAGSKPHPTAPLPVPVRTVLRPGSRGPNPRRGASDRRSKQARLPRSVPLLTRIIP